MKQKEYKSEIIKFVENSSDEDNLKIAIFIAGMRAQKKLNLSSFKADKEHKGSLGISVS